MSRFNQVLIARIKSYIWRAFGIGIVALLGWAARNVGLLDLPIWHFHNLDIDLTYWLTTGLGLLLGEIMKYFNINRDWVNGLAMQ